MELADPFGGTESAQYGKQREVMFWREEKRKRSRSELNMNLLGP